MRLDFDFAIDETDTERRVIRGLGVPWEASGTIEGRRYQFARGSLKPERPKTPLLLGHDGEPVGVLAELVDADDGAHVEFRIDETPEGDRALVQAASGSRGSLSIGADVDKSTLRADGSVLVTAARYVHFALVPHGAFVEANVEQVIAERTDDQEGEQMELDKQETPEDENGDENGGNGDEKERVVAHRNRVRVLAERTPELSAGEFAVTLIRAEKGDGNAARILAALTESPINDLGGVLPPQYERTVLGGKTVDRVLYSIFGGRPLPAAGTQVVKPKWTTGPSGAWAAALDADATTSAVVIGTQPANIERWDWAGAFPWIAVQRADPDLFDTVYGAAVIDFYEDVEHKIAAELLAAGAGAATTLGMGIAEFYSATEKSPEVIVVSADVWGEMADSKMLDSTVGAGGVSGVSGLSSTFAGLTIAASGALGTDTAILATRRALDVRVSDPVRLTANAIGALNVELGVVGEGLFDTDYPDELLKITIGGGAATSSRSSSKSS